AVSSVTSLPLRSRTQSLPSLTASLPNVDSAIPNRRQKDSISPSRESAVLIIFLKRPARSNGCPPRNSWSALYHTPRPRTLQINPAHRRAPPQKWATSHRSLRPRGIAVSTEFAYAFRNIRRVARSHRGRLRDHANGLYLSS